MDRVENCPRELPQIAFVSLQVWSTTRLVFMNGIKLVV